MARKKKVNSLVEPMQPKEALAEVTPTAEKLTSLVAPATYNITFSIPNKSTYEIQIPWTELEELPEVLSKWLKKNGIDNNLIVK